MSRALTAAELATLRTRPIRSQLYCVIQRPRILWSSQVAVVPTNDDQATQFTADDLWNLAPEAPYWGATIRITDSVVAGKIKGYARLRYTVNGSAIIRIGETSEIDWAVGDVVEVLDEFRIWPRAIREVDETTVYVDEVAYVAQHTNCNPVPIMGPNLVVRMSGGSIATYWDSSSSWEPGGGAITYLWTVTPNDATIPPGQEVTATPTIAFGHAKCYRVTCAVTVDLGGANERTSYGHRYVFVLPEIGWTSEDDSYLATPSFAMSSCSGSYDDGGWTASVTLYDANTEDVHENALCVLCSDDWHGSVQQNIGLYIGNYAVGRNNVIMSGWLGDDSISWNPDRGSVSFELWGPHRWLDKVTNLPMGLFDTQFPDLPAGTSLWLQFVDLTVDKGLWHLLYWRSTITLVCDAYLTGDTRQSGVVEAPVGSLWRQINSIGDDYILARAACDKLGRLFARINEQVVPVVSRTMVDVYANSAVPLGLHKADWRDSITIKRQIQQAAQVDSSGISYLNGVGAAYWSLSQGHMPAHYGGMTPKDRLLLVDQPQADALCGLLYGMLNNKYPSTTLPLAHLQKVTDIAPAQCVGMVILAGDTEIGLVWPDHDDDDAGLDVKRLIPRRISYNWDATQGVLLPDLECEAESWPGLAITGDPPPAPPPPNYQTTPPPFPPMPPGIPDDLVVVMSKSQIAWSLDFYTTGSPTWHNATPSTIGTVEFHNIVVGSSGEAYLITLGDLDSNGIWYTPDITAGSGSWSLIKTMTAMAAETGGGYVLSLTMTYDDHMYAIKCGQYSGTPWGNYWYYEGVAGVLTLWHKNHTRAGAFVGPTNAQFTIDAGDGVAAWAGFWDDGGVVEVITNTVHDFIGLGLGSGQLSVSASTTTSNNGHMSDLNGAFIRSDVDPSRAVVDCGGHVFWVRNSDGYFMQDAIIQALPHDVGGVPGVFGTVASTWGHNAFCSGYGEILAVANTAAAQNDKRSIAHTVNGGVTWLTKDGNFAAVCGAWAGGYGMPIIRTVLLA